MATVDKGNRRSLYVGGLDRQVTEQALYSAFVPFGPLKAVQIPLDFKARTLVSTMWLCDWLVCNTRPAADGELT